MSTCEKMPPKTSTCFTLEKQVRVDRTMVHTPCPCHSWPTKTNRSTLRSSVVRRLNNPTRQHHWWLLHGSRACFLGFSKEGGWILCLHLMKVHLRTKKNILKDHLHFREVAYELVCNLLVPKITLRCHLSTSDLPPFSHVKIPVVQPANVKVRTVLTPAPSYFKTLSALDFAKQKSSALTLATNPYFYI